MYEPCVPGLTRRRLLGAVARMAGAVVLSSLPIASVLGQPAVPARIDRPRGVCFLPDGSVLVSAREPGRGYQLLRVAVDLLTASPFLSVSAIKSEPLNFPTRLAMVGTDTVAVAETNRGRIRLFGLDGRPRRTVGAMGFGLGQFHAPSGLCVRDGLLLVADTGNQRVQAVDQYGQSAWFLGHPRPGDPVLRWPRDVAVLSDGTLYVLDAGNGRILVFDAALRPKHQIPVGPGVTAMAIHEASDFLCFTAPAAHRLEALDLGGAMRATRWVPVRLDALAFHADGRLAGVDVEAGTVSLHELH